MEEVEEEMEEEIKQKYPIFINYYTLDRLEIPLKQALSYWNIFRKQHARGYGKEGVAGSSRVGSFLIKLVKARVSDILKPCLF
ncbi:hypothetical protein QS257_01160 [Terrilactibacillus sp. S3-3]|nr:hypothetical protein QS257_01160 [Terrilactibacillus sp. S3-3]